MATMPDIRGMTEPEARDAMIAAGFFAGSTLVAVSGASGDGYDDADFLGATSAPNYAYAGTVTADGTISYQEPSPGTDFSAYFATYGTWPVAHVWGADDRVTSPISPFLDAWGQTAEATLYDPDAADPLISGPWVEDGTSSFRIELTTLHKPGTPAEVLTVAYDDANQFHQQVASLAVDGEFRRVVQFSDPSVKEVLNDQTEARFTMSMFDPMVEHIGAYECAARIFYRNQVKPIFWAPVTFEEDYGTGTVVVTGINVRRLQKHNLRRDDDAINRPDDQGAVTLDGAGLGLFLAAAQNTPAQDARDVPVLGIALDDRSASRDDSLGGVERGDNVWDTMREWVDAAIGPDFEFDPQPDNTDGIFMKMRVWDRRGSDRTANVRWFYNVTGQADNLSDVNAAPLQVITHAHVLDDERRYRRTRASTASSALRGVYVEWVPTTLKIHKKPSTKKPDLEPLDDIAQAYIDAYANAPRSATLTLRPDAGQDRFYREHFWPGDHAFVHARKGLREFSGDYRIREVELLEEGSRGPTRTVLTVVPYVPGTDPDEDS